MLKRSVMLGGLAAPLLALAPASAAPSAQLLAAAKREGSVVWYSSLDAPSLNALVDLFNRTHPGITVTALRLGSSQIPPRVLTERTGGKYNADVVSCDQFAFSQMIESDILDPFTVSEPRKLIKGVLDPKGTSVAFFLDTTAIAWNPELLKADGLQPPTSLADLAKPEWRGKIGIDGTAFNWYQSVLATQKNGAQLLQQIAANKSLITTGHTETIVQLTDGEFDATPTAYGYMAEGARLAGRPIDFINMKPIPVGLELAAILKNAPHPNAARVLVDWLVSVPVQQYFAGQGRTPVRTDVKGDERVFSASVPYYVLPQPDRSTFNTMVSTFKALLGMAT